MPRVAAASAVDVRSRARGYTDLALRVLSNIAAKGSNESARVAAAGMLLDRGWGKAQQDTTTRAEITVIVRRLIQDDPKLIEHAPIELDTSNE